MTFGPTETLVTVAENDCWIWTGATSRGWADNRYGVIWISGRDGRHRRAAHRVAYELLIGPISDGLVLDHLCKNTLCVNPDHLEPVTQAENVHRSNAMLRSCDHPDDVMYRKANGRIAYCSICRRQKRRDRGWK